MDNKLRDYRPPISKKKVVEEEIVLEKLLDDIDILLAYHEDFTHGKDGNDITQMRKRISDYKKTKLNITLDNEKRK